MNPAVSWRNGPQPRDERMAAAILLARQTATTSTDFNNFVTMEICRTTRGILLHHKAKLDTITANGLSSLHHAAYSDYVAIIELPARGAFRNKPCEDASKFTPLYGAAQRNNFSAVRALLGLGVDLKVLDCLGETSLCIAARYESSDFLRYLKKGAKIEAHQYINVETDQHKNGLSLARQEGHTKIEAKLLSSGASSKTADEEVREDIKEVVKEVVKESDDGDDESLTDLLKSEARSLGKHLFHKMLDAVDK
ncbi:hypothetical protein G7Y89_g14519 [Cudoniella acicularis]|uniref:Ankyrin n=1 Tax=Cudoniella acicularis TaxID=354080 RepID=A0A8H4VTH2_9HELO|nr:hypothetical protein G7Y89_g14519 [Cudoniella acicularis]